MTTVTALADTAPTSPDIRGRILNAAAKLLAEGGREALTTRAVVAAAGIQQPTLYRLFGDKTGLLDAVAEAGLAAYVAGKATAKPDPDPLVEFRLGWDRHVEFGLTHPALFAIIWGDPNPSRISPAAAGGLAVLRRKIRALATVGRLRVTEARAVNLAHAACTGAILTLLDLPEGERDPELTSAMREAVISAITYTEPLSGSSSATGAAITLRASLNEAAMLTPGEKLLLDELLDRIAGSITTQM